MIDTVLALSSDRKADLSVESLGIHGLDGRGVLTMVCALFPGHAIKQQISTAGRHRAVPVLLTPSAYEYRYRLLDDTFPPGAHQTTHPLPAIFAPGHDIEPALR